MMLTGIYVSMLTNWNAWFLPQCNTPVLSPNKLSKMTVMFSVLWSLRMAT